MVEDRGNTKMLSVLFVDIVGYSKKTNAGQMKLKGRFVALWRQAIQDVPPADIMVVDAGDGAALTALVEQEDTIRVAQKLRDLMLLDNAANHAEPMYMRMGINFGPVQLSKDVHGKDCIVGDAINMAQRVMSFADPGQITVSRSYYDVILPLADKYKEILYYLGKKADKHVRYHDIYGLGDPGSAAVGQAMPEDLHEDHPDHSGHAEESKVIAAPVEITSPTKTGAAEHSRPNEKPPASFTQKLWDGICAFLAWPLTFLKYGLVILIIYEVVALFPIIRDPVQVKAELYAQFLVVKETLTGLRAVGEVIEKADAGQEKQSGKPVDHPHASKNTKAAHKPSPAASEPAPANNGPTNQPKPEPTDPPQTE